MTTKKRLTGSQVIAAVDVLLECLQRSDIEAAQRVQVDMAKSYTEEYLNGNDPRIS